MSRHACPAALALCVAALLLFAGCPSPTTPTPDQVAVPTFNPPAGMYSSDQSVSIGCSTPGATIYYSTDGSSPTTSSSVFGAPIPISGPMATTTIMAIAVKPGMATSAQASARYTVGSLGAGIVSWEDNVYVLGGVDASGAYRSEVWRASVDSSGALGAWTREVDLPRPLAFAACAAFGGMVYVVGGRDAGGLRDEISFTTIQSGGTLGFTAGWATNSRPLPAPRSAAAPVVVQGRLFLVGGETAAGPQSSILSARFWNDGQVGQWYEAPNPLPEAGTGFAAAIHGGRLWVIGGNADATYSAIPDDSGLPGPWSAGLLGGGSAAFSALASTADGLLAIGGGSQDAGGYAETRTYDGSAWSRSAAVAALGPHCAVLADTVFVLGSVQGSEPPVVRAIAVARKRADAPRVSPSDGNIRAGSAPSVTAYPGDTVRYTTAAYGTEPADPTESDPDANWEAPSPSVASVSADASYAFRAFRSGAEASEIVRVTYRSMPASMFVLLQATIFPQSNASGYTSYSLTETYSNGTTLDVSSVWYQTIVAPRSCLRIGWADASDEPTGAGYTARVRLSLFEDVAGSTPARAADGSELFRLSGGFSNPATAALEAGTYYLNVQSTDGSPGGTFGLLVAK